MARLKKIFLVLFFFQLSTAAAFGASAYFNSLQKQVAKSHPTSPCNSSPVKTIQQDEFNDDDPESSEGQRGRTRYYVRFVHNRTNYSAAILPVQQSLAGFIPALVKNEPIQNVVRDACLPSYYNFLFRLSPF